MNWNNKILAIVFFVLLGIWILKNFVSQPKTRSFRATLVQVDTSMVNKIMLYPKGNEGEYIQLSKNGSEWKASNGTLDVPAESARVGSLLGQLVSVPTKQLITKSAEKHADYEVNEEKGKIIELYQGEELVNKLIFGRFNFNQNTRTGTSYARLADEDDVYALDGFMSMSFDTDFNSFRNKKLMSLSIAEIKGLVYNGNPIIPAESGMWNYSELEIDSLAMANYLNGLSSPTGTNFSDAFIPSSEPDKSLQITADNRIGPITIQAFAENDKFIIKSSENDAFFESDSVGIFNTIFGKLEELLIQ